MVRPPDDGLNTDGLADVGSVRLIRVTVDAELADLVSDRFWQAGVRGVTEHDLPDGRVEVTSSVGDDQDAIDRTIATFDPAWNWVVDDVDATPGDSWKRFAEPVWFGHDRVILPSWVESRTVDGIGRARTMTVIDPGSTFGLGDHPTTRSSAALLAAEIERGGEPARRSLLDVGCGTGVLAVLAAQMGIGRIRAVDVAHAAVGTTRHNAALNGVDRLIDVDDTPVDEVPGEFDVVVANILAPVLVSIAHDLRRLTAPDGTLIVSGVLARRHDHVMEALAPMRRTEHLVDDGWITIALRH